MSFRPPPSSSGAATPTSLLISGLTCWGASRDFVDADRRRLGLVRFSAPPALRGRRLKQRGNPEKNNEDSQKHSENPPSKRESDAHRSRLADRGGFGAVKHAAIF